MGGEVLSIIPLSCFRAGGGRVSDHLGRAMGLVAQVFDHDTFSADDIMGEAEIDIHPLITSTMAFGDAGILEDV
uniref:Putative C2 domain-containing protein n=1 Tax=Helianthus annuus TaxID=4232 RepID=A0A251TTA8_HELAN